MVNGEEAKVNGTILVSLHTCPVFILVTVTVMVTVGLQPSGATTVYVFPVPGDPQGVDDQLTEVIVHPPNTCDVLFITMVLLPFNPQEILLLKSAFTGTSALVITVNGQPLQVTLAVTPYTPAFAYVCVTVVPVAVPPSPNDQLTVLLQPVKLTLNVLGLQPLTVIALKGLEIGGTGVQLPGHGPGTYTTVMEFDVATQPPQFIFTE